MRPNNTPTLGSDQTSLDASSPVCCYHPHPSSPFIITTHVSVGGGRKAESISDANKDLSNKDQDDNQYL